MHSWLSNICGTPKAIKNDETFSLTTRPETLRVDLICLLHTTSLKVKMSSKLYVKLYSHHSQLLDAFGQRATLLAHSHLQRRYNEQKDVISHQWSETSFSNRHPHFQRGCDPEMKDISHQSRCRQNWDSFMRQGTLILSSTAGLRF